MTNGNRPYYYLFFIYEEIRYIKTKQCVWKHQHNYWTNFNLHVWFNFVSPIDPGVGGVAQLPLIKHDSVWIFPGVKKQVNG